MEAEEGGMREKKMEKRQKGLWGARLNTLIVREPPSLGLATIPSGEY